MAAKGCEDFKRSPMSNNTTPLGKEIQNRPPTPQEVKEALRAFFDDGVSVPVNQEKPKLVSASESFVDEFDTPANMQRINVMFAKENDHDPMILMFISAAEYSWATAPAQKVSWSHFLTNCRFLGVEMPAVRLKPLWNAYIRFLTSMSPPRLVELPSLDPEDVVFEIR
jgi:hypothetical protein